MVSDLLEIHCYTLDILLHHNEQEMGTLSRQMPDHSLCRR